MNNNFLKTQKAFTLAEMLVTLTLLGTLAAIVIPNAIQEHKKKLVLTRLKIAYSLLIDVTEQSRIINGPPSNVKSDTDLFDRYFRPYLQIQKDCGFANRVTNYKTDENGEYILNEKGEKIQDGFKFKNPEDINNRCFAGPSGGIYDLNGNAYENNSSYGNAHYVVLKNGMGLSVRRDGGFGGITIYVDVDGPKKGYSKLGQDTFMFTWASPSELGCPNIGESNCSPHQTQNWEIIPGGLWWYANPVYYLKNRNYSDIQKCKKDMGSGNGFPNGGTCSVDIIKNNFKFPSNYPWEYANERPKNFNPVK